MMPSWYIMLLRYQISVLFMFHLLNRLVLVSVEFMTYQTVIIRSSFLGRIFLKRTISWSNNLDPDFFYKSKFFFPIFNKNISQRKHIGLIYNNSSVCVFNTTNKILEFDRELSGARFIKSLLFFVVVFLGFLVFLTSFGRRPSWILWGDFCYSQARM